MIGYLRNLATRTIGADTSVHARARLPYSDMQVVPGPTGFDERSMGGAESQADRADVRITGEAAPEARRPMTAPLNTVDRASRGSRAAETAPGHETPASVLTRISVGGREAAPSEPLQPLQEGPRGFIQHFEPLLTQPHETPARLRKAYMGHPEHGTKAGSAIVHDTVRAEYRATTRPDQPGHGAHDQEPTEVHVTIGRIEVTAVTAPMPPKRVVSSAKKHTSLEEYLARSRGGGR